MHLSNIDLNSDRIFKNLVELDTGNVASPDKIPPFFWLNCSPILSLPLSVIFTKSLNFGQFPTDWKYAIIAPLHKGGDRTDAKNYCPISGLKCGSI